MSVSETAVTACHECDLLQRLPPLAPGKVARCRRCGARLRGNPRGGLDTPLALSLGALILYLIANLFPLLELDLQGRVQETTLTGTSLSLVREGMAPLGAAVWITSVLVPGLTILVSLYVLTAARFRLRLPGARTLWGWIARLRPWGMVDVFMLGVLVAMVKLGGMAQILVGPGLYGFVPLLFFSAGVASTLEPHLVWERLGWRR